MTVAQMTDQMADRRAEFYHVAKRAGPAEMAEAAFASYFGSTKLGRAMRLGIERLGSAAVVALAFGDGPLSAAQEEARLVIEATELAMQQDGVTEAQRKKQPAVAMMADTMRQHLN